MKNKGFGILLLLLIFFGLSSSQFFETEKISSETFLEEEIKAINWKEVDQYPVFQNCENETEKEQQKSCFETTLINHLYQSIQSENTTVSKDINETIIIDFIVNEKGELSISNMKIDSILSNQLPFLEHKIIQGLDSLQPIAPAYKRGIPVKTTFKLPIIIKTNS
ncbi:MAG: hypothetical protein L3J09_10935 [Flavobacteriaceae bacterium]|nr:hypothetical protein [Flavobacteriaceae bacterium]